MIRPVNYSLEFEPNLRNFTFNGKEKNEILTIHLSQKINDSAQLCLEFIGILNDRLLGFYKSEYKDARGKKKYLATTQFEAADARRAFPCWDEPEAKATFDISIITDNNL